jgi:phosphoglycolate phosphatase-like HAD superfamily hydrolase
MRRLAAHYGRFRSEYPQDQLLIVFDIDGTILDMRHMVRHVLLSFDQAHGSDWFHGLTAYDVTVHENRVDRLLRDMALPASIAERVYRWYLEQRWQPEAVLAAHRPYQGVLDVIRWFQIQPDTSVALNTGRPEYLRAQTLHSLNALGEEYRVEFSSELLHMNPGTWEEGVAQTKVAALAAFRDAGYRVFAVVDNEPGNIRAMAESDVACEILFLHAATLYESARTPTPRTVSGEAYDITALVSEGQIPQHVQMVWHGVNDEWNLRQFLASRVTWGECDLRVDPLERLVLRHDSFEETPWRVEERLLRLPELVDAFGEHDRALKLDLKQADHDVLHAVLKLIDGRLPEERLWFNAAIESLGEPGFRQLAARYPSAIRQCPIDFAAPLVFSAPGHAKELLDMLCGWGVNRFSIAWGTPHTRRLFDQLERWGHDVNIYAVPDLAAFLQAALLLPRSLTADFNFPQWHYFGRGSGAHLDHHTYRLDRRELQPGAGGAPGTNQSALSR